MKVPWSGVTTGHSTSPFPEDIYENQRLSYEYEVVINRWPQDLLVFENLGIFLNTIKRILDVLHCRVEDMLKSWASYLPAETVEKLASNMQANRYTRLKKILEEIREEDGEAQLAVDFGTNWDRLFRNFLKGGKKTKYGTMDCHALGVSDPLDTLLL
ncbi:hypothetical protein ACFE04_027153 [Oxalis oulophora]